LQARHKRLWTQSKSKPTLKQRSQRRYSRCSVCPRSGVVRRPQPFPESVLTDQEKNQQDSLDLAAQFHAETLNQNSDYHDAELLQESLAAAAQAKLIAGSTEQEFKPNWHYYKRGSRRTQAAATPVWKDKA